MTVTNKTIAQSLVSPERSTLILEISIVMPCLNEADTLAVCIEKARRALDENGLRGEIIVADNGSTDGSQEIARAAGARVISVAAKGYGNALRGGIAASHGQYVVFGDADDSYNFLDVPRFIEKLREGYDLVMGNRFQGGIHPGAMPWKHKYIGNPVLSGLGRLFFRCPVGDFHCGLRGFSKDAYERMELCTTGMEFASEMVIKATLKQMRISEISTELYPDGRLRPPHLRSWRDGWRHLRLMLLFCPRWLFLIPGGILFVLGMVVGGLLLSGPIQIGAAGFDIHTLLVAGLSAILGHQLIVFGLHTKRLAVLLGLYPDDALMRPVSHWNSLEHGVVAGGIFAGLGVALLTWTAWSWQSAGFVPLEPEITMRRVIPSIVLTVIGVQTAFSSFFLNFLQLVREQFKRRELRGNQ